MLCSALGKIAVRQKAEIVSFSSTIPIIDSLLQGQAAILTAQIFEDLGSHDQMHIPAHPTTWSGHIRSLRDLSGRACVLTKQGAMLYNTI